jgi:REP element-mobilizing transposase RayT
MSQSLVQVYLHLVFSTKNRAPYFTDDNERAAIHAYLAGICRNLDSPALIVGGAADHVHILCRHSKSLTIVDLLRDVKRASSVLINEKDKGSFHWQTGYGAFSVSPGHIKDLTCYIANQAEHHRDASFQDEFRRICKKYGLTIDERYVWD